MTNRRGKSGRSYRFIFLGSKITVDVVCSHNIKRCLFLGRKTDKLGQCIKAETSLCQLRSVCQSYGFSSSRVRMCELEYKEAWALKNWCFWTVVLEKTLESPLDCKEIQPIHLKRGQSWVFIGRTDVEAETPVLWLPPDAKSWFIWKDPDAGKHWGQEKMATEDEMVG